MNNPLNQILEPETKLYSTVNEIINAGATGKGTRMTVLDVSGVFDLSDVFIVTEGTSDRQVQGICKRIIKAMQKLGRKAVSIEGYDDAQWVLMDFDDIIVHVFYSPVREHYNIEGLWHDVPSIEITDSDLGNGRQQAA